MSQVLDSVRSPFAPAQRGIATNARILCDGKYFRCGSERWFLKGLTYGPFAPNSRDEQFPENEQFHLDAAQMIGFGANAIRVYHLPSTEFLDQAYERGLRVFVDIPWEKHRCFFEDWSSQEAARKSVRETARRIGNHPGLFALSVVNEIPNDVVRFYGHRRVERFVDELLDIVKQESPSCLATFANFPTNEFLRPRLVDFHCFNVYLDDAHKLASYLDRLQLVAGNLPLILGEFGADSHRQGKETQARRIVSHVQQVFEHGLAGSFIFSFTDDWFTGGKPILDWDFGIVDRNREPKPAAAALQAEWANVPRGLTRQQPKVSVVVCSYNGAATLRECLESLSQVNYPDYEVILIDDGSTDNSAEIARDFPNVRYFKQKNLGLSAARNQGARFATGKIVAYTDSDCMVDPDWLTHLVAAMFRQNVNAIGGPNIPPPSDCAVSKCVAASPGGPSHVMLDDRYAEHIPGCNMAYWRDELLLIGGFDHQFRAAGDDVDVCWRYLDRGWKIGYAASAVVWHKRRTSVSAYLKQQKGYGRAEAMLRLKHPHRFNKAGGARWHGVIYGEGAIGLPVLSPVIYHGQFGSALFQTLYTNNSYSLWSYPALIEWHVVAAVLLASSMFCWPLVMVALAMWALSLSAAVRHAAQVPLPRQVAAWSRPLIAYLSYAQPLIRGWHRWRTWLAAKNRIHASTAMLREAPTKPIAQGVVDLYWNSSDALGRHELLTGVQEVTEDLKLPANFYVCDKNWDFELLGDPWHEIRVHTATEELGWPRRFTRCRVKTRPTGLALASVIGLGFVSLMAIIGASLVGELLALGLTFLLWGVLVSSRRECLSSTARVVAEAARVSGLDQYRTPVETADTLADNVHERKPVVRATVERASAA